MPDTAPSGPRRAYRAAARRYGRDRMDLDDSAVPARFVGIYDADGTLSGELRYALGKLTGRSHCALCDITHGWNPTGSREWQRVCAAANPDLELVHRDEASADHLAAAAALPSIVMRDGNHWIEALTRQDIAECDGSPDALVERLEQL